MSPSRLRLVTFNIAHGRGLNPIQGLTLPGRIRKNLRGIATLIHKLGADVVALQEIDRKSRWAGNFDHLRYLSVHSFIPHFVFGINNQREGLLNLSYGNALLAKDPIVYAQTVVFGRKRVGEKGFLFVELNVQGRILPLVNVHLHYRSRRHRMAQLEHMIDFLAAIHKERGKAWGIPPIVCGDFNTPHETGDAATTLYKHLQRFGEYRFYPIQEGTFPSPWPTRTIDFIFLPRVCRHVHASVVKSLLSDHRPVFVEFDF